MDHWQARPRVARGLMAREPAWRLNAHRSFLRVDGINRKTGFHPRLREDMLYPEALSSLILRASYRKTGFHLRRCGDMLYPEALSLFYRASYRKTGFHFIRKHSSGSNLTLRPTSLFADGSNCPDICAC